MAATSRAQRREKRMPLKQKIAEAEAEIARINGIIAKIDTALALPDLFTRDPKQAAQLGKARAGAAERACSAPRKNGWRPVRNMMKRRAERPASEQREHDQVAAGFFFAFGLAAFGCATGSGPRSIDVRRPAVKV